jgi:hypothetical protein
LVSISILISKLFQFNFSVNSTGLIRPQGEVSEFSKLTSTNPPTNIELRPTNIELRPTNADHRISDFFVGVNNTNIYAHVGTTAHFDCLVARPNLDEHGPVRLLTLPDQS